MKCVSKHDVAEHLMRTIVRHINRRIKLKIARQVAGEADGRCIARAALEIHLRTPGLVEIVGVSENYLVAKIDMYRADDELLMFGVVTGFNIRLRIDMKFWRPVNKTDRK